MKKFNWKIVFSISPIIIILILSICSQVSFDKYGMDIILEECYNSIFKYLLIMIGITNVLLGINDLKNGNKKIGIVSTLCGLLLLMIVYIMDYRSVFYLWNVASFVMSFTVYVALSVFNVYIQIQSENSNILPNTVVVVMVAITCLLILFYPIYLLDKVTRENLNLLSDNLDDLLNYDEEQENYILDRGNYDTVIINSKGEVQRKVGYGIRIDDFFYVIRENKKALVGAISGNESGTIFAVNNRVEDVFEIKSIGDISIIKKFEELTSYDDYLIYLLKIAKENGIVQYDSIETINSYGSIPINGSFADGSKIIFDNNHYYGYIDTNGNTHIKGGLFEDFAVNAYEKYIIKYNRENDVFKIQSKEDDTTIRQYERLIACNNYMISITDDAYEFISPNDLSTMFKVKREIHNKEEGKDGSILNDESERHFSMSDVEIIGNESLILLDTYSPVHMIMYSTLVRYDKEKKEFSVLQENIYGVYSPTGLEEYTNRIYEDRSLFKRY